MYGVINSKQLYDTAKYVCDILGHGANGKAVHILLETAAAETNLGKTKDTTKGAGTGLTQFDKLPFQDVKERSSVCLRINKKYKNQNRPLYAEFFKI